MPLPQHRGLREKTTTPSNLSRSEAWMVILKKCREGIEPAADGKTKAAAHWWSPGSRFCFRVVSQLLNKQNGSSANTPMTRPSSNHATPMALLMLFGFLLCCSRCGLPSNMDSAIIMYDPGNTIPGRCPSCCCHGRRRCRRHDEYHHQPQQQQQQQQQQRLPLVFTADWSGRHGIRAVPPRGKSRAVLLGQSGPRATTSPRGRLRRRQRRGHILRCVVRRRRFPSQHSALGAVCGNRSGTFWMMYAWPRPLLHPRPPTLTHSTSWLRRSTFRTRTRTPCPSASG
jgi:hypothetical protein